MTARLRSERGWALVTAVMVMGLMMTGGLAAFAFVDGQARQSARERTRESAFNLAEATLNEQLFLLGNNWPGANPYPTCTQSSTGVAQCPNPTGAWLSAYNTPDYASGVTWSTRVVDNGGQMSSFYSDSLAVGQPPYDANHDGVIWIRAQATVRGQKRVLVTQAKMQTFDVSSDFPHNVITAGSFETSNNGNHGGNALVNTGGSPLDVRCLDRLDPNCLSYQQGQVSPDTTQTGYGGGNALPPDDIAALRSAASANGTYYPHGCPPTLAGAIVFVETTDGQECSYTGNDQYNSPTSAGVLIIMNGSLYLGGTVTYYGIIYAANGQGASGSGSPVVETHGDASVQGAIAVDGQGNVNDGSSGGNITYDSSSFSALKGLAGVSALQNTWREVLAH